MNEKLKFSWGHILAFVAIIFMGYITFMGATYLFKGSYVKIGITVVLTLLLLVTFFIGAQFFKGTEKEFKKRIWVERFFVCLAPILILLMIRPFSPFAHFWAIENQSKKVKEEFGKSISGSKQLFTDYDIYANNRIDALRENLTSVVENKNVDHQVYEQFGFIDFDDEMQIGNRTKALEAQLKPTGYDSLKLMANKWIDEASRGASVWNVFLIGNVSAIKAAIKQWHSYLQEFSKKQFSIESDGLYFDANNQSLNTAISGLDELTNMYGNKSTKSPWEAWLSGFLCYLFLMVPYFVQRRSTQSRMRLFLPKKLHIEDDKDPNHGIIWSSKSK